MATGKAVILEGARRSFVAGRRGGAVNALDGLDLEVAAGEMVAIVGPSGSGKTTLLRAIAGLETLDSGSIVIGGRDVAGVEPGDREVAMVFQDGALYPHLTVAATIGFGLRTGKRARRRTGRSAVTARVEAAAAALGIEPLLDRRPHQLSGGERQRVALARVLVREPAVFLLDEPFASLDPPLRVGARRLVRDVAARLGATTIHVTHDPDEAMVLGDRVAVVRAGRVEQMGTPQELYDEPATVGVASLIGSPPMNVIDDGRLGIRPSDVRLARPDAPGRAGTVVSASDVGDLVHVEIDLGGVVIAARVPRADAPRRGGAVAVGWDPAAEHHFDSSGCRRQR